MDKRTYKPAGVLVLSSLFFPFLHASLVHCSFVHYILSFSYLYLEGNLNAELVLRGIIIDLFPQITLTSQTKRYIIIHITKSLLFLHSPSSKGLQGLFHRMKKAKHYVEIMPGSTNAQEQSVWTFLSGTSGLTFFLRWWFGLFDAIGGFRSSLYFEVRLT